MGATVSDVQARVVKAVMGASMGAICGRTGFKLFVLGGAVDQTPRLLRAHIAQVGEDYGRPVVVVRPKAARA